MTKAKTPILSIILYFLAVLFLAYTVWAFINGYKYISELIDMGMSFRENRVDIITYFVANCAQYLAYAVIISVLGWMLQRASKQSIQVNSLIKLISELPKKAGDDFDDWFEEARANEKDSGKRE